MGSGGGSGGGGGGGYSGPNYSKSDSYNANQSKQSGPSSSVNYGQYGQGGNSTNSFLPKKKKTPEEDTNILPPVLPTDQSPEVLNAVEEKRRRDAMRFGYMSTFFNTGGYKGDTSLANVTKNMISGR
jgi:hypothetical protein